MMQTKPILKHREGGAVRKMGTFRVSDPQCRHDSCPVWPPTGFLRPIAAAPESSSTARSVLIQESTEYLGYPKRDQNFDNHPYSFLLRQSSRVLNNLNRSGSVHSVWSLRWHNLSFSCHFQLPRLPSDRSMLKPWEPALSERNPRHTNGPGRIVKSKHGTE